MPIRLTPKPDYPSLHYPASTIVGEDMSES